MQKHLGIWRFCSVASVCILAGMACELPGGTATGSAPSLTSTPILASITPTETVSLGTDMPTATEPVPTATFSPIPPSPTATPIPPTATLDISGWLAVVGTWSGCVNDATPGVPYTATPCTAPTGNFVTLWIKPTCVVGEYCGNYVKARFESEFVLLKLTLLGLQGSTVWMHGEAGPMFPDASTDVAIVREGGNKVRITEKAGYKNIFLLPRGCDSVIVDNTGMGCFEYLE